MTAIVPGDAAGVAILLYGFGSVGHTPMHDVVGRQHSDRYFLKIFKIKCGDRLVVKNLPSSQY